MAGAAKKVNEVLDVVERIAAVFAAVREWNEEEHDGLDDETAGSRAEAKRDDMVAEVLDASEEAQVSLAAALTKHAYSLTANIFKGDDEDAALGAVILRALSAHTQAEAVRSIMDSPDLSQFVNINEDDPEGHDDD